MAIVQALCSSFLLELHQAIHDFDNDTFYAALYTSAADLSGETTAYTTDGEVSGTGYTAGGRSISFGESTPKLVNGELVLVINDISWSSLSLTTRGALFYNSSKANRAWCVLNFGTDVWLRGEPFSIPNPVLPLYKSIFPS
jgi:hypothetical protein